MNTSAEAINQLQQALDKTRSASDIINNLIAEHDYQDVAAMVAKAAEALLESALSLMQSNDEAALAGLERAEDLLDSIYDIIDSETEDDE